MRQAIVFLAIVFSGCLGEKMISGSEVQGLVVCRNGDDGKENLQISGLIFNSALSAKYAIAKQSGDTLYFGISGGLASKNSSGSFVANVDIAKGVNIVCFGSKMVVWRRLGGIQQGDSIAFCNQRNGYINRIETRYVK